MEQSTSAPERAMKIRVLGAHNLESRETRHTCFLVDGVLALDAGSLASALTPDEQRRVRAVLLTHLHFDHTRDIPTMGLATLYEYERIDLYSLPVTLEAVHKHLIDGTFYPDFTRSLDEVPPRYRLNGMEPGREFRVLDYRVKALPMLHPVPSVGYIVTSESGPCFACSGDTHGNLRPLLEDGLKPQVLFVEVTYPSRKAELAKIAGHLTPARLRSQLAEALDARLALPRIIAVHMSPADREEIVRELGQVAAELGVDLTPGHEDMLVSL